MTRPCRIEADVRMRANDPDSTEPQVLAKVEFLGDAYVMAKAISHLHAEVRVYDHKGRCQFTFHPEAVA